MRTGELAGPLPRIEKTEQEGREENLPGFEEGRGVIRRSLEEQETDIVENKWVPLGREYTIDEQRVFIAMCIMIRIETSFGEHRYEFN